MRGLARRKRPPNLEDKMTKKKYAKMYTTGGWQKLRKFILYRQGLWVIIQILQTGHLESVFMPKREGKESRFMRDVNSS